MKTLYHVLVSALIFVSLTSQSCKKNKTNNNLSQSNAVITGFDQRACVCCGGLMINFNEEAKPYIGQFYLVDNDLSGFGVANTSSFPIYVNVEWTALEKCSGQFINITKLSKR